MNLMRLLFPLQGGGITHHPRALTQTRKSTIYTIIYYLNARIKKIKNKLSFTSSTLGARSLFHDSATAIEYSNNVHLYTETPSTFLIHRTRRLKKGSPTHIGEHHSPPLLGEGGVENIGHLLRPDNTSILKERGFPPPPFELSSNPSIGKKH
jgi:hypothetical protein